MQTKNRLVAAGGAAVLVLGLFAIAKPAITAVYSTPMRDVDNPGRQPITGAVSFTLPNGQGTANSTMYTVPAGQVLVIDTISSRVIVPTGLRALVSIQCAAQSQISLFPTLQYTNWDGIEDMGFGTQSATCFAMPGANVVGGVQRLNGSAAGGAGSIDTLIEFSGHLITLP